MNEYFLPCQEVPVHTWTLQMGVLSACFLWLIQTVSWFAMDVKLLFTYSVYKWTAVQELQKVTGIAPNVCWQVRVGHSPLSMAHFVVDMAGSLDRKIHGLCRYYQWKKNLKVNSNVIGWVSTSACKCFICSGSPFPPHPTPKGFRLQPGLHILVISLLFQDDSSTFICSVREVECL